jgi:hypothetical protein
MNVLLPLHLPRVITNKRQATAVLEARIDLHMLMRELTNGKGFRRPRTSKHANQRINPHTRLEMDMIVLGMIKG